MQLKLLVHLLTFVSNFIRSKETIPLLFIWSLTGLSDILSHFIGVPSISRIVFGFVISFVLSLPVFFFKKGVRIYAVFAHLVLLIPATLSIGNIILFENTLQISESYYVLFETTPIEIWEYLQSFLNYKFAIVILLIVLPPLICLKYITPYQYRLQQKLTLLVIAIISLFVMLLHFNFDLEYINRNSYYTEFGTTYYKYCEEKRKMAEHFTLRKSFGHSSSSCVLPDTIVPTYIVVIGESASRHHMGLYGYPRNTTPLLNNSKNELYAYENVISAYCHTIPVMKTLLTFATRKDTNAFYKKESIIELFNNAGYNTYWLSNQQTIGINETQTTVIAKESTHCHFTNRGVLNLSNKYDEILFPELDKILKEKSQRKIVFMHLMGAHSKYVQRYPKKFNKFTNDSNLVVYSKTINPKEIQTVNEYDNAILYNDYVLYSIIERVKKENVFSYVIYLSDHGEEVYDKRNFIGHAWFDESAYMYEIPFIFWASDKYKEYRHLKESDWKHALKRYYCTEDVIHSILDLSSIKTKNYDSTRSIFSPYFIERDEYKHW